MDQYPKHIAIILDGNRRYGQKKGSRLKGHAHGAKKIEELLQWCKELRLKEVTLYSFSLDNFKRPRKEVELLLSLFRKNLQRLKKDKEFKDNTEIKIMFMGRLHLFPADVQNDMKEIMEKTKQNKKLTVNFAMAYSGKAEIVDAFNAIMKKIGSGKIQKDALTSETINAHLYLSSCPDLLIRPGGEKRLSDFLIWQSAYAELFFTDTLWPEFTKSELKSIIDEFMQRERRFGK